MTAIEVLDPTYIGLIGIVTVALQFLGYLVAYFLQVDKITDFLGSMNYVINVVLTLFLGGALHARQMYLTWLIVLARLYLGFYLLYRVIKRGHDGRFDGFRNKPLSFLGFWVFQMVWVFSNTLPIAMVNSSQQDIDLNGWDYAGLVIMVVGLFYEIVGDQQKRLWKENKPKDAVLCADGLWGHTRHPNYFGEICIWVGAFISCIPVILAEEAWWWIGLISPITTIIILLFLGGLPTAEGAALKGYYRDDRRKAAWEEYRARTSILIPFPPCLYVMMPMWAKRAFCFEWELYEYTPPIEARDATKPLTPTTSEAPQV